MAWLAFFTTILVVIGGIVYSLLFKPPPPIPEVDLNAWWGPNETRATQDLSIRPYKIVFSDGMIKDLQDRLNRFRKPFPALDGIAFEYGFSSSEILRWSNYWAGQYPFKKREQFLNKFPQFKTNIQGLDIHFLKITPEVRKGKEIIPMLILHGWPGSVREFYEAIPYLTAVSDDRDFAVEVIAPSLPGFGFSDGAVRPGMGPIEIAVILRNFMHRLGHKQFYVQGGDWGAIIADRLVTLFPDEVLGYHTNFPYTMTTSTVWLTILGAIYPPLVVEKEVEHKMYPLSAHYSFVMEFTGYLHIQASKPDSIGVAFSDSPIGLLVYIFEKFVSATNRDNIKLKDGGLDVAYSKEKLIDNLMFYWVGNSMTTAIRLYAEGFNKRNFYLAVDDIPSSVPTWTLQARHEIVYRPPFMIRLKYPNLVNNTHLPEGGHFLALELPKVFSANVLEALAAFRTLRNKIN